MNASTRRDDPADSNSSKTVDDQRWRDSELLSGLTSLEVKERLERFGTNELKRDNSTSNFTILIRQFQSTVIALLLVATAISFFSKEYVQGGAILCAVLINALIGFFTEVKAKISLAALDTLASPTCRVVRDGSESQIQARWLVPGDIVILAAGDRVPADIVILDSAALSIEESMLTGESIPVYKKHSSTVMPADDDADIAFQGTMVLFGRAKGRVMQTGDATKVGRLGRMLQETVSVRTPLEMQLEKLGQQLTWLTILMCIGIFVVGALQHINLFSMLQTSIALAVAAIPEGLPVVSTLALAAGTRRMVRAGALIRQLSAVETLGCTTIICTDKTGTLTENRMLVTDLIVLERQLKVSGSGYEPSGAVTEDGKDICFEKDAQVKQLLHAAALCNDAKLEQHANDKFWHIHGDPTEGALLTAAAKIGLEHSSLLQLSPRIFEFPFDLNRKRMTTVHNKGARRLVSYIKGSPETVVALCEYVKGFAGRQSLTPEWRDWFLQQNGALATQGLRVLAVACNEFPETDEYMEACEVEKNLTLLGLIGMSDQPRDKVDEAIKTCQNAGIRILMLTGDQLNTATSVARSLNILPPDWTYERVLTGRELQNTSNDKWFNKLKSAQVLARVTPEMKLNVVRHL